MPHFLQIERLRSENQHQINIVMVARLALLIYSTPFAELRNSCKKLSRKKFPMNSGKNTVHVVAALQNVEKDGVFFFSF